MSTPRPAARTWRAASGRGHRRRPVAHARRRRHRSSWVCRSSRRSTYRATRPTARLARSWAARSPAVGR
eukprot:4959767-Prymnesium_polylepis.1